MPLSSASHCSASNGRQPSKEILERRGPGGKCIRRDSCHKYMMGDSRIAFKSQGKGAFRPLQVFRARRCSIPHDLAWPILCVKGHRDIQEVRL